jgi:hypothetical protein
MGILMDSDDYQRAWQAHSSRTRVTIDADLLLKEVQRSQSNFQATIFWRDFREVGVALVMLPVWFYLGVTFSLPWTWYLTALAFIWVAGFLLVDRMRHKAKPGDPGKPLLGSAKESLTQVEHQIWLLRNVFWWYLLPFVIPILAFFAQVAWRNSKDWLEGALAFAPPSVFVLALYCWIYWLNQRAVRLHLEPRRQELLALVASLSDETTDEVTGEYPILMGAKGIKCSPRRSFLASLCSLAILLIGVPALLYLAYRLDQYLNEEYPKKSPFAAVRWHQTQPEVKVGDEWFKLVSLDGLPASEIVAFSQKTYGDRWQKRFEEDLVELLTRMGHPPQDKVTLVVQSLASSQTRTLENVPMTRANRRAIRDAAQARERDE